MYKFHLWYRHILFVKDSLLVSTGLYDFIHLLYSIPFFIPDMPTIFVHDDLVFSQCV